jgi:hypothetical protein
MERSCCIIGTKGKCFEFEKFRFALRAKILLSNINDCFGLNSCRYSKLATDGYGSGVTILYDGYGEMQFLTCAKVGF